MAKRKIKINDVGLDERYCPMHDTHNLYSEGYGRKIHILDTETGRCLCGYEPFLYNLIDFKLQWGDIVKYLGQADPDGDVCKRCREIMINALDVEEM